MKKRYKGYLLTVQFIRKTVIGKEYYGYIDNEFGNQYDCYVDNEFGNQYGCSREGETVTAKEVMQHLIDVVDQQKFGKNGIQ